MEGCFDLWPDVKYPHLGATTLPNLGAKLHLGAIRNELSAQCGQERRIIMFKGKHIGLFRIANLIVIAYSVFLFGCASTEVRRLEKLHDIDIQYVRSWELIDEQPLSYTVSIGQTNDPKYTSRTLPGIEIGFCWKIAQTGVDRTWEYPIINKFDKKTGKAVTLIYLYECNYFLHGEFAWKGTVEMGEIESRVPNPGHVFAIWELNFKNISGIKITIKNSDINLIDASGNKWSGNFWTPIGGGVWAGNLIEVSKSMAKVISEDPPKQASRSTEEDIVAIKLRSTSEIVGDSIKMLFEVPESKSKDLKLMFLNKVVSEFTTNKVEKSEYDDEKMLGSGRKGADWKVIHESKVAFFFYDAESKNYPSKRIIRVTGKTVPKNIEEAIKSKEKHYGLPYKKFAYTLYLNEINCSDKKCRVLSIVDYDDKGNILHSKSFESDKAIWIDVPKNSAIESLFNIMCR